jgi:hypothetical protein
VEQKRSNLVQENSGEVFHGGEKRTGAELPRGRGQTIVTTVASRHAY